MIVPYLLEGVSLTDFATIASLILSVVAIVLSWLFRKEALEHNRESTQTNRDTKDLLIKIETQANLISQYAMSEMSKWQEGARGMLFKNPDMKPVAIPERKEGIAFSADSLQNESTSVTKESADETS